MTDREKLIGIVKSSLIKHIDKSCCLAENIVDDLLTEGVTTRPVAFSDNRRERMIELLGGYYEETGLACVHYFTDDESEMLADYILADGWIRPPCKVGDTVYCIDELKGGIFKGEVNIVQMIGKDNFGVEVLVYDYSGEMPELFDAFDYDSEDFGVDVFVGKNAEEEAEKALKEREKND